MTTPRVVVLDLELADGAPFPEHEPGAHIDVLLDQRGAGGALVRQYSLCGDPSDRKRYRIAVLREQRSRGGSAAMHELKIGDRVRISAPRSSSPLRRPACYRACRGHRRIVRHFSDTVTVSCIQEMRIRMVPELPSFVIQAAVFRVWVRQGGSWQLARLQLARRFPPG
jgi:hypothetical protein